MRSGGRKPWPGRFVLLAVSTACALGAAELVMRVYRAVRADQYAQSTLETPDGRVLSTLAEILAFLRDPAQDGAATHLTRMKAGIAVKCCYDRPRWSYFDERGCVDYRTNGLGFRDHEFTVEKPAGAYRVLALGDSFTFGVGVRIEDCWTELLEAELARSRGQPVEVINGGLAVGYMPSQYLTWLARGGLDYDPDLVVVGLCLNDVGPVPMVELSLYPGEEEDAEGSRLELVRLARRFLARHAGLRRPPQVKDLGVLLRAAPALWQETRTALSGLKRLLDQRDVPLLVVVFPMFSGLEGSYPFRGLHTAIDEFCRAEGIGSLDLMDVFLGRNDFDLWVHPTDQHPNDVAHRIIADAIFERLDGGR